MTHLELHQGEFFSDALMQRVKNSFFHVDHDFTGRPRLFLDNAGGSLRLKKAVETYAEISAIPDCAERIHNTAVYLQDIENRGKNDFKMMLNAQGGSVYTSLTASKAMFDMVRVISEHAVGSNMVTTILEHPSAYDAMALNAKRSNRELRIANSNALTGGVDVDDIIKLIDQDTALLSVIYASNISGAKLDIAAIVKAAKRVKPDLYIVVDAVQHAPHGIIDLQELPIDGINIAPYKFFGCRGMGLAWLSERVALLSHDKLSGKPADVWDLGSSDPAQYAMFSEVINYVCGLAGGGAVTNDTSKQRQQFVAGMQMIGAHEQALLARLLNGSKDVMGLREMEHVDVYLDYEDLTTRDLILAINFKNIEPAQAVKQYDKHGITVFERVNSSLYSKRMLESFGLEGAIRVSPLHCHSAKDVDKFLTVTKAMA